MSEYKPDKWVIVKISTEEHGTIYKVLGGWQGGYLDGDSWRISSGLEKVEKSGDYYLMHNFSGSVYKCHKNMVGLTVMTSGIISKLKEVEDTKVDIITVEEFEEIK